MAENEFDWNRYGHTVLSNIEKLEADLIRIHDKIEKLQELTGVVKHIERELDLVKLDLERVRDSASRVRDDLASCKLKSVTDSGESKIVLAEVKRDVKNHAATIAVFTSLIFSIIAALVIWALTKKP